MSGDHCEESSCKQVAYFNCKCNSKKICKDHIGDHLKLPGFHKAKTLRESVNETRRSLVLHKIIDYIQTLHKTKETLETNTNNLIKKVHCEYYIALQNILALEQKFIGILKNLNTLTDIRKDTKDFCEKFLLEDSEDIEQIHIYLQTPYIKYISLSQSFIDYRFLTQDDNMTEKYTSKVNLIRTLDQLNSNSALKVIATSLKSDSELCRTLLEIIKDSAKNPDIIVPASRAFTVLSKHNYDFSNENLNHIKLHSAEITSGHFYNTSFIGADLSGSSINYQALTGAICDFATVNSIVKGRELLTGHLREITSITFAPNGSFLVSTSLDCFLRVWELKTGFCQSILVAHSEAVNAADVSKNSDEIVSCSDDGTVRLWDPESGSCKEKLVDKKVPIKTVKFSSDSKLVIFIVNYTTALIVDKIGTEKFKYTFNKNIQSLSFTKTLKHDEEYGILAGTSTGDIKYWKTGSKKIFWDQTQAHSGPIIFISSSKKTRYIITACADGLVKIWASHKGKKISKTFNSRNAYCYWEFKPHDVSLRSLANPLYNKYLFTLGNGSEIKIWNYYKTKKIHIKPYLHPINCFGVSSNMNYVAVGLNNNVEVKSFYEVFIKG